MHGIVHCCCTNGEQRGVLCNGGVHIAEALSAFKPILCTNSAPFAACVPVGCLIVVLWITSSRS